MVERDTAKPPRAFVRLGLVILFVPMLMWTVVSRLGRELCSIPPYVWWDCCEFVDGCAHMWRTGELPTEDEW